ncbi:MAG: hypothetical protein IPP71_02845 [Bacteroidetes bacterium]|nr:hypothetical protein [Bacteroidota bacterium]
MKYLSVFLLTLFYSNMNSQPTSPVGIYYLESVMETASGFKVDADSTFEFFFSQGALDRTGKGTWTVNGNQITFNTPGKSSPGYILKKSEKTNSKKTVIVINESNTMLLSFNYARLYDGKDSEFMKIGSDGVIEIESTKFTKIELFFELCPERTYAFEPLHPDDNYFEFTIDPTIMNFYFTNVTYKFDGKTLKGIHPLLKGDEFIFSKEN